MKKEGRISLTDLVGLYGASIGIKDTLSDKSLAKRQLDILAQEKAIIFRRDGRDLVAAAKPSPQPPTTPAPPAAPTAEPVEQAESAQPAEEVQSPELQAIKAYAQQLEAFAETVQQQVSNLVKMVETAQK
ncbi:MAG: hypothetical protein V3T83_17695 [Acidobacteriota bacterium]